MWPFNCKAAVSITYDDGHDSNLDSVIPDLEDRGLRGTFFLTPSLGAVRRPEEWRSACRRGHEIANHTWDHPCDRLGTYSYEMFASEQTGKTEQWLNDHVGLYGIPGKSDDLRTYAYICGEERLGTGTNVEARARYLKLVQETFWAARSVAGGPATREQVLKNPYTIPAQALTFGYENSDKAIEYCENAAATGEWAVLIFHYIVEGKPQSANDTNRQIHREILDYLADNSDKFWVAPFRDVVRHIRAQG